MLEELKDLKKLMESNSKNLIITQMGVTSRICGDKAIESLINFTERVIVDIGENEAYVRFKNGIFATIRTMSKDEMLGLVDNFSYYSDLFVIEAEEKVISRDYIDDLINAEEVKSIDYIDYEELTLILKDGKEIVITYL